MTRFSPSGCGVPVLETGRLFLHEYRLEDYPAFEAMWKDEASMRHILNKPLTEEEIWSKFLRNAGHWPLHGFGGWTITEKASGAMQGEIGFAHFKREIVPPLEGIPEIGCVMASHAFNKGYAIEAGRAVFEWWDRHSGMQQTAAMIDPQNRASRLASYLAGYRKAWPATYKGKDMFIFLRPGRSGRTEAAPYIKLDVPVIETARLRLRGYRLDDFSDYAAMCADKTVHRYLNNGQGLTLEQAWAKFQTTVGHWVLFGHGKWAIEEKASGRFIGDSGLFFAHRDMEPALKNVPELGYVLTANAHGQGYGREVVSAVLGWADANLKTATKALIDEGNAASLKIAGSHGYREIARPLYHGEEVVLLMREAAGSNGADGGN